MLAWSELWARQGLWAVSLVGAGLGGIYWVRWQRRMAPVVILCWMGLALGRGMAPLERAPVKGAPELVAFEVVGAALPGKRCLVQARRVDDRGTTLWLSLPHRPCRWALGDRIELPRGRLHPERGQRRRPLRVSHYVGQHQSSRGFWVALSNWRQALFSRCDADPGASFVLASVTGMPRVMRRYWVDRLRQAGLGHLTAVSGLHVGTLAQAMTWLLLGLTRRCKLGSRGRYSIDLGYALSVSLASVPVLAFVCATGLAASACRALLCWGVWALGVSAGFNLHKVSILGWIAWGMLVVNPHWSGDPGFYCSFVATAILLWHQPGQASSWSTSWQLAWGLAPLSLFFFEGASLVSVAANLVAIPVFGMWVLPLGLSAVALAAMSSLFGVSALTLDAVVGLMQWAGMGGRVILGVAEALAVVPIGGRWDWALLAAWILACGPSQPSYGSSHPLYYARRPLLWLLVSAPLWGYLGM